MSKKHTKLNLILLKDRSKSFSFFANTSVQYAKNSFRKII